MQRKTLKQQTKSRLPAVQLNKRGPKSNYKPEYTEMIRRLVIAFGYTTPQLADYIGVSEAQFQRWMKLYPELAEAVAETKDKADAAVVVSLHARALGYSHPAQKFFYDKERGKVVAQNYIEHYPPDTTACIFWLKNRRPDLWRDVVTHGMQLNADDNFVGIPDEKLAEIVVRGMKAAAGAVQEAVRRERKTITVQPS